MASPYCTVQEVAEFMTQMGYSNPAKFISNIILSGTDEVQIYAIAHEFVTGDVVTFLNLKGTTGLLGNSYQITVIDANNFTLDGTDSSLFSAFVLGFGIVYDVTDLDPEGTWPDYDVIYRHILLAGGEIDVTLQASDQLNCTKDAATGGQFLKLLNIVGATLLTEFDNARYLDQPDLARYQAWKDKNLELIRTGQLALCQGETGLEYPAFSTAEQALTLPAAAKIIQNYFLRNQP